MASLREFLLFRILARISFTALNPVSIEPPTCRRPKVAELVAPELLKAPYHVV